MKTMRKISVVVLMFYYTTGVEYPCHYSIEKRRCIIWLFGTIKDTFEPVVTDASKV